MTIKWSFSRVSIVKFGNHNTSMLYLNLSYNKVYFELGNFPENIIFANSIKRYIYNVKNLRLGLDLHISVNDRVILQFCEGFIFMKLGICEVMQNKTLPKISNLHYY